MPLLPGAEPLSHEGGPVGVLVLHGFTGSPKSMRPWAEHLSAAGFSVEMPRLPGHGTTWKDLSVCRWDDWYAETERAFSVLRERCDQVFSMGLSVGGSLSLRLAQLHPDELTGLVLVNPAVDFHHVAKPLLPLLRHVIPAFPGIINDIKKPGQDEGGYDKIPLNAFNSVVNEGWKTIKAHMGEVRTPVLLMHSREDHTIDPSDSAWILEHISSVDVTEVVLENSYHVATIDNDAQFIFDTSVDFVHRLAPQSPGA